MTVPSWGRFPGRFTIVFVLVAVLLFVLEHVNGRFWLNDFRVYYGAGEALLNGEALYGVAHGLDTGVYKYSPVLALFYAMFALLPYGLAASIQYALIVFAFVDGSLRIDRLVRTHLFNGRSPAYSPLFLTGLVCVVHLHRELHLGNINMQLLWLLIVALERILEGRTRWAGLLMGVAILAKPHFVVLLPLLLLRKEFKVLWFALAALVIGLLLPSVFLGFTENIYVHREWLSTMAAHNASLIHTGGDDHRAVNTVYSFMYRSILDHFTGPTGTVAYALLSIIAACYGAFVLCNIKRGADHARSCTFEFLLLVAIIPSITLTDTEHFLLAMPMGAYLLQHLLPRSTVPWLPWMAVPVLFAYGGNWEDALGPFSALMVEYGVLGIGNIALLVLCVFLFVRSDLSGTAASNR
jgi:hypothetical protein